MRGYCFVAFLLMVLQIEAQQGFIIPQPQQVSYENEQYDYTYATVTFDDPSLKSEARILREYLSSLSANVPVEVGRAPQKTPAIRLSRITADTLLPDGWYSIRTSASGSVIQAIDARGAFYGVQSMMQQLKPGSNHSIVLHAFSIDEDYPRFQWRGMHLDVSRHFFPVEFIKRYIDLLAMHKMNTFHWHLTDDQGWRIEIKSFPKLTEVGAWRKGSMVGHYSEQRFDSLRYGGFYTQEDVKQVVAYARERHVTIVPEIEMPGHAKAALAAYPEFSCTGGPFEVERGWGVFDDVFCPTENTFGFLQQVLDEVMLLFPGKYIHIGGDECPKTRWESCEKCKKRMQDEGLKDGHELQSYFIQRIERFVNSRDRQIIGWDEILEGGLAPNAAVMSWRGTEGGIAAASQNHPVVMSPGSHCYFDHYQADPRQEPVAIGGLTTLEKVLQFDPVPETLKGKPAEAFILGAQGNVWTEYINTPADVERMALPRLSALAEVLWTGPGETDYSEFLGRLNSLRTHWDRMELNYSRSYLRPEISPDTLNGIAGFRVKAQQPCVFAWDRGESRPVKLGFIPISTERLGERVLQVWPERNAEQAISRTRVQVHKALGKRVTLSVPPSEHYPGKGGFTLVDGLEGVLPRVNREWLGWSGDDVTVELDLGMATELNRVELGLLHDPTNWIYAPDTVEISSSVDGKIWTPWLPGRKSLEKRKWMYETTTVQRLRYFRFAFKNAGVIPQGSPGAGKKSWLFLDEIAVY